MGDVNKFIKRYNIVMPELESCKYYLHYNVMLLYPEEQTQTKFVEKDTVRQTFFQTKKENLSQVNNFDKESC